MALLKMPSEQLVEFLEKSIEELFSDDNIIEKILKVTLRGADLFNGVSSDFRNFKKSVSKELKKLSKDVSTDKNQFKLMLGAVQLLLDEDKSLLEYYFCADELEAHLRELANEVSRKESAGMTSIPADSQLPAKMTGIILKNLKELVSEQEWMEELLNNIRKSDDATRSEMKNIYNALSEMQVCFSSFSDISGLVEEVLGKKVKTIDISDVYEANTKCDEKCVRKFYQYVDNRFSTMLRIVSSDEEVAYPEAEEKIMELLEDDIPVIITGNSGQGKTTLMMRIAVDYAKAGNIAVWLEVSKDEVITETDADEFWEKLVDMIPEGKKLLLCIDAPSNNRSSFANLQKTCPESEDIQLILSERKNRMQTVSDANLDLLQFWFDDAEVILLQGGGSPYDLKSYEIHYFAVEHGRKVKILDRIMGFFVKDNIINAEQTESVMKDIVDKIDKSSINIVELIYRTLFAVNDMNRKQNQISKLIPLDWDEWEYFINQNLNTNRRASELYGIIAAMSFFDMSIPLNMFCEYFGMDEKQLRMALKQQNASRYVEPVIFEKNSRGEDTLRPKHDVVAQLFFLFNRYASIDSLMCDLIGSMNEDEIFDFLRNAMVKKSVKAGRKYPIGKIAYWKFIDTIINRIKEGKINLTLEGRALLCTGYIWASGQQKLSDKVIEDTLADNAPPVEPGMWFVKLYTEWGIWETSRKKYALAEKKFRAVIDIAPENYPTQTELGRLLAKQRGREGEAEEIFSYIISMKEDDIPSRTELGKLIAKQKGREDEAERIFTEIIGLKHDDIHSRTELGKLLAKQHGREAEAEKYFREAMTIDPNHLHSRTEMGKLLARQKGREAEAERYFREAMNIDSRHLHSRTELGKLLAKQKGREEEAEKLFLEVIELDNDNLHSRTELGKLLSAQPGRENEAENFFKEAINLDSTDLHPLLSLAKLYRRMGRTAEANELYRDILKIDPGNSDAIAALK